MLRFLYLNIYSFLLVLAGILTLVVPFYFISKWLIIIQIITAIKFFAVSGRLFSTWKDKKREIDILVKRNLKEFRPETFEIFMQAPCGRLIVHQVLKDLHKQEEYQTLLKLQKPFFERWRNNLMPVKTVIYINEDFT